MSLECTPRPLFSWVLRGAMTSVYILFPARPFAFDQGPQCVRSDGCGRIGWMEFLARSKNSYTCCSLPAGESDHIGAWAAAPVPLCSSIFLRVDRHRLLWSPFSSHLHIYSPAAGCCHSGHRISVGISSSDPLFFAGIRVGATLDRCRVVGR